MEPKYGGKTEFYYMDTDSFKVYIKTKDILHRHYERYLNKI